MGETCLAEDFHHIANHVAKHMVEHVQAKHVAMICNVYRKAKDAINREWFNFFLLCHYRVSFHRWDFRYFKAMFVSWPPHDVTEWRTIRNWPTDPLLKQGLLQINTVFGLWNRPEEKKTKNACRPEPLGLQSTTSGEPARGLGLWAVHSLRASLGVGFCCCFHGLLVVEFWLKKVLMESWSSWNGRNLAQYTERYCKYVSDFVVRFKSIGVFVNVRKVCRFCPEVAKLVICGSDSNKEIRLVLSKPCFSPATHQLSLMSHPCRHWGWMPLHACSLTPSFQRSVLRRRVGLTHPFFFSGTWGWFQAQRRRGSWEAGAAGSLTSCKAKQQTFTLTTSGYCGDGPNTSKKPIHQETVSQSLFRFLKQQGHKNSSQVLPT